MEAGGAGTGKRKMTAANALHEWRNRALNLENALNATVLGLKHPVRQLVIAMFARGHVLLEGNVGVARPRCSGPLLVHGEH